MKHLTKVVTGRALLLVAWVTFGAGEVMAIEEPKYTLIDQAVDFELRQYEPHIVAETLVDGTFSDVGKEGFRRLAGYIYGKNRSRELIDMTAPVNQAPSSERIAMTAPVNQAVAGAKWRITFTMPAAYRMETLPEPLDHRVTLRQEPARLMAAIRYSGTWRQDRFERQEARLRSLMRERGLEAVGESIFARYNPPFALWFLRRNEVLIPVERRAQ